MTSTTRFQIRSQFLAFSKASQSLIAILKTSAILALLMLGVSMPARAAGLERPPEVFSLQHTDRSYLSSQRALANDVSTHKLGTPFRKTSYDLETLQRVVDGRYIGKNETLKLQALGVILGDLLAEELGLNWVVYKDKLGRSRALCVGLSSKCLFPVTMISRRIEGGAPVNVRNIYEKAKSLIKPHMQYGPRSIYD